MSGVLTPAPVDGATTYDIELVEVTKRYDAVTALSEVSLDIEPGEFLVLLGPSGCGKSTILKIIAGLEDATEGDIYIKGKLANYIPERDAAMGAKQRLVDDRIPVLGESHRPAANDAF